MEAVCTTCSHVALSPRAGWIQCISSHKVWKFTLMSDNSSCSRRPSQEDDLTAGLGELSKRENQICSNTSLGVSGKWANYYLIYNFLGPPPPPHTTLLSHTPPTACCSCFDLMSPLCQPATLVIAPFPWLFNHWLKTFALGRNNWLPLTAGNSFAAPGHEHENQL